MSSTSAPMFIGLAHTSWTPTISAPLLGDTHTHFGHHPRYLALPTFRPEPLTTLRPLPSGLDPSFNSTENPPFPPLLPTHSPKRPPTRRPSRSRSSAPAPLESVSPSGAGVPVWAEIPDAKALMSIGGPALKASVQYISRALDKPVGMHQYEWLMRMKKVLDKEIAYRERRPYLVMGGKAGARQQHLLLLSVVRASTTMPDCSTHGVLSTLAQAETRRTGRTNLDSESSIVDVSCGVYYSFPGDNSLRQLLPNTSLESTLSDPQRKALNTMRQVLSAKHDVASCAMCGWLEQSTTGLVDHVHELHLSIKWMCECGVKCGSRRELVAHTGERHNEGELKMFEELRKRRLSPFVAIGSDV